jgi:alpha,alpha-trehalase
MECGEKSLKKISREALPQFVKTGGITGSTKGSTANAPEEAPQRHAIIHLVGHHQMLLWEGLINHNYLDKAQELEN